MLAHLGHFIGTVIGIFFGAIGSTLLGLLIDGAFAASLAAATLYKKSRVEGWRAMLMHWRKEYKAGLKFAIWAALIFYGPVVVWSVGRAVYEDHQGLVDRYREQRAALQRERADDSEHLIECRNENARLGGQKDTLNKQNRDQQDTINRCQQDAIKFLAPTDQKTTSITFGSRTSPDGNRIVSYLLLTNKIVEPVHMKTKCDADISSVFLGSVGISGIPPAAIGYNSNAMSDGSWRTEVASPAWTPTAPYVAVVTFNGVPESNGVPRLPNCDFDSD